MTPSQGSVNKTGVASRILVVDDSAGMRLYLRTIITGAGFTCVEATDGAAAFDLLLREEFDVVVTDLHMPKMDGFELISALGLLPAARKRPAVIVASARLDEDVVQRRPELSQASRLLEKPVGVGELLDAIAAALPIRTRTRCA
ncbi:MAG: response regulator [Alphaproteobacteria bacterium]